MKICLFLVAEKTGVEGGAVMLQRLFDAVLKVAGPSWPPWWRKRDVYGADVLEMGDGQEGVT